MLQHRSGGGEVQIVGKDESIVNGLSCVFACEIEIEKS